jgi:mono/diheme cytochrome c family protein
VRITSDSAMGKLEIVGGPKCLAAILLALSCCFAAAGRSVWDGVYTKEQALRGQTTYGEECARCHAQNLGGGESAPALAGNEFLKNWNGKTVGDMLERIMKTMPGDDPGSLARRQYADITAWLLSANAFPAGSKDLDSAPDALRDIAIAGKGSDGRK